MNTGKRSPINGIAAIAVLATVLAACGGGTGGGATTIAGDTATTAAADTTMEPEATTTTEATTTPRAGATTTTVDAVTRICRSIQCVEGRSPLISLILRSHSRPNTLGGRILLRPGR